MRKSLLLLLILALTTAFSATAKTIEIGFNSTDLNSSDNGYATVNFTKDGVSFHAERVTPSSGQISVSKTPYFVFYNTTAIANIQKVELYLESGYDKLTALNAGNFIITTSNDQLTSTGTGTDKAVLANDILTFTPSVTTNSYFRIDLKSKIGGIVNISKMVITYGESVAPETKPEKPTFSVTPGEVAKGTSVTISSKDATSLTIKSKTADATDWATKTVTGETYTVKITEAIDFEVIGIKGEGEGKLESEAATASYTVKADTPVPGGNITATVIFKNQKDLAYGKGKEIVWAAEEYPSITFSTTATISGSTYSKNNNGNLRIYNSNGNVITISAPKGYTISQASATYSNTKSAIIIDGNQVASNVFPDFITQKTADVVLF